MTIKENINFFKKISKKNKINIKCILTANDALK